MRRFELSEITNMKVLPWDQEIREELSMSNHWRELLNEIIMFPVFSMQ